SHGRAATPHRPLAIDRREAPRRPSIVLLAGDTVAIHHRFFSQPRRRPSPRTRHGPLRIPPAPLNSSPSPSSSRDATPLPRHSLRSLTKVEEPLDIRQLILTRRFLFHHQNLLEMPVKKMKGFWHTTVCRVVAAWWTA
ncbi:unnamed protein product, partial [Urochloa humidicola]